MRFVSFLQHNLRGRARCFHLQGVLPESSLRLRDKVLDAGAVPLGASQSLTAQLCNTGTRAAAFCVLPNPLLKVSEVKVGDSVDVTQNLLQ